MKGTENILKYNLGQFMPKPAIYGGYLLILVGIGSLFFGNVFLGLGIILLGMLVSFTFRGVIIDIKKCEITTYTSILWLKRDKTQKKLTDYRIVTVNKTTMRYRSYSWANRSADFTNFYYTLFVSRDTNKRGIPVATFRRREIAIEEARRLEKLFDLKYQPTMI